MGTTSRCHNRPPPMSKAADFEHQEEQTRHDVTPKARALATATIVATADPLGVVAALAAVVNGCEDESG